MYLPRCVSMSLAPALLFSAAYSFGSLRTSNELIVIHGSGVSLASFSVPVLLLAGLVSLAGFLFEDRVALPSLREKNSLARVLLGQKVTLNNAEIALLNRRAGVVWTADYFDNTEKSLSGVSAVRRDGDGRFVERVDARRAVWDEDRDRWNFQEARIWSRGSGGGIEEIFQTRWSSEHYSEPPASFRRGRKNLDELTVFEAREYVRFLKSAGLPYAGGMAEYYERYAFGLTPLVVTLLSIGAGGRLRKNIVLSSLLISLASATVYYVTRMVSILLARMDLVSPFAGAVAPLAVFLLCGVALFRTAHT